MRRRRYRSTRARRTLIYRALRTLAIAAAISGKETDRNRALQHLVQSSGWRQQVIRYVLGNSGTSEDGEEVFFQALTILDRNVREGKFEGRSALNTYFNQIAKFLWLKQLAKRRPELDAKQLYPQEHSIEESVERHLIRAEHESVFGQVMAQIGERSKRIFELFHLGHAGFIVENGKSVAIDPFKVSLRAGKADIVLITHSHFDHCSIEDIERVAKKGAVIVAPADCQSRLMKLKNVELQIVEVGDQVSFGSLKIDVVPAYNVKKEFHPKSEGWVGYVLKMGSVIIYHAGDSDFIPEMQKLSGYGKHGNQFVALLPVSGKHVMTAEEALEAAEVLHPDLCIPMHFGEIIGTIGDAERFVELCKERKIEARIVEKR